MNGFTREPVPGITLRVVTPVSRPCVIFAPQAHQALASSETSTSVASPVFSRWNSAAEMPPAIFMPPIESPNAGIPMLSIPSISAGVIVWPTPLRVQKAVPS